MVTTTGDVRDRRPVGVRRPVLLGGAGAVLATIVALAATARDTAETARTADVLGSTLAGRGLRPALAASRENGIEP